MLTGKLFSTVVCSLRPAICTLQEKKKQFVKLHKLQKKPHWWSGTKANRTEFKTQKHTQTLVAFH